MLAGAFCAFLLAVELCARLDDYLTYQASPTAPYSAENLRSSSNGLPFNVPMASFEKWRNNSYGFRGPEISKRKAAGKVRVGCLGSSETYGLYETSGKEWPAQLQALLGQSRYEVLNASVAGLSLKKYGRYFDSYLAPFRPDIIVLVVNPLFYFTSQERSPQPTAAKLDAADAITPSKKAAVNEGLKQLRSLPKGKQALKQGLAASFPDLLRRWQLYVLQKQLAEIEFQRLKGRKPRDSVPASHLVGFHNELAATVAALQADGARVVLTTYPSLINKDNVERYLEIFLDNRRFCIELSLLGMIDAFQQYNAVIGSVAAEQGALLVETDKLIPKTSEYFGDNVHYTDKGAALFARGVAEVVRGTAVDSVPLSAIRRPQAVMGELR